VTSPRGRPSRSRTLESRLDPPEDHVALIASRVDAIAALRKLPYPLGRFEPLVQQVMWDVTEYRRNSRTHKVRGVRWRTPDADRVARQSWAKGKDVRHEHVVDRLWMFRLLGTVPDAAEMLWQFPACLATKGEHLLLPDGLWAGPWGWERYVSAGLSVIDAPTGEPVDLVAMATDLRDAYRPLVGQALGQGAAL
jgi:hypothetical protein